MELVDGILVKNIILSKEHKGKHDKCYFRCDILKDIVHRTKEICLIRTV